MSAPAPVTPSRSRLTPPRLLLAVAFAAVGFVVVWQGFGLAGFGTDVHVRRVFVAVALLFAFGLILVWPDMRLPGRVLAAVLGCGAASAAWWFVPNLPNNGLSLGDAVEQRDSYKEQLATATLENFEQHQGLKGIAQLREQYPSLAKRLAADHGDWTDRMWLDIRARYDRTPPDDVKTVLALRAATRRLAEVSPAAGELLGQTDRQWVTAALHAKLIELTAAQHDWEAFDRTAPGRHALAEAFPEVRSELVRCEEEWAEVTALGLARLDAARAGGRKSPQGDWRAIEKTVLNLKSVDTGASRFLEVRRGLFNFAHDATKSEVAAHLDAGRYEAAFGLARKHAVEWNATATVLGAGELKQLDSLRDRCAALVKPGVADPDPADEPDIAPPPRAKPQ